MFVGISGDTDYLLSTSDSGKNEISRTIVMSRPDYQVNSLKDCINA